jgi:hypothetical protein
LWFSKVLMDGGISLNILYAHTLRLMGIRLDQLRPSMTPFHCVAPGKRSVDWAAVTHPQTNGQVERANGMILQGLKPKIFNRLNKSGKKWLQGLPSVV